MRHRQGHFRRFYAVAILGTGAVFLGGNAPQSDTANVTITATDLRNSKGVVRACMTTNAKKFPKCRGDASAYGVVVAAGRTVTFTFKGVKPGRYAIALLHDENNNGKADRALLMMPKEGFGFSRDAKVRMGPPKFKNAAFDVTAEDQAQFIKMRYML